MSEMFRFVLFLKISFGKPCVHLDALYYFQILGKSHSDALPIALEKPWFRSAISHSDALPIDLEKPYFIVHSLFQSFCYFVVVHPTFLLTS